MKNRRDRPCHSKSIAGISAAVIAVGWFVAERPARAQRADAETLFARGIELMKARQVAQACDMFEASNRIEPRAGTLIALGECREQTQQLASAWSAYKDALARAKEERKRKWAKQQVAILEARLSHVTVLVRDGSKLEGLVVTRDGQALDPVLWNQALPIDGGDYIIAGHAPGHEDWQATVHVPIEGGQVNVEVPTLEKLPAPLSPAESPIPVEPPVRTAASPKPRFTTFRKISIGAAGLSVVAMTVGVVLGESAKTKQDDAFKLCPDPATACTYAAQANALSRAGHSRSVDANIALGAGAAAAIAAGVLWFTGAPDPEASRRVGVVPRVAPGEAGLAVQGRF